MAGSGRPGAVRGALQRGTEGCCRQTPGWAPAPGTSGTAPAPCPCLPHAHAAGPALQAMADSLPTPAGRAGAAGCGRFHLITQEAAGRTCWLLGLFCCLPAAGFAAAGLQAARPLHRPPWSVCPGQHGGAGPGSALPPQRPGQRRPTFLLHVLDGPASRVWRPSLVCLACAWGDVQAAAAALPW